MRANRLLLAAPSGRRGPTAWGDCRHLCPVPRLRPQVCFCPQVFPVRGEIPDRAAAVVGQGATSPNSAAGVVLVEDAEAKAAAREALAGRASRSSRINLKFVSTGER